MSSEKAPKKTKTTIQVSRNRGGGKKRPDLFAHLRNQEHPLDSLLPAQNVSDNISDTRDSNYRTSEINQLGQTDLSNTDTRDNSLRTSDISNIGHPNNENSDTINELSRTSENPNLGHTAQEYTDTFVSEPLTRTHEKKLISDTKTHQEKISDARESEKIDRKKYDLNYESKRKNDTSRDRMNLRPNLEIGKKVRVYCAENKMELTEFFEVAAVNYIENHGHTSSENSDTKTPYNNKQLKMMWKTKPLIINLYYAYNQFFTTKVKWTAKDDLTGQKFNDVDPRVIELGIIQTQANLYSEGNQKTTINGFLYYANEINRFVIYEENPEMLDTILQINRKNWEKITGKSVDLKFLEEGK